MPILFMEGFGQCPTGSQVPDTSLRSLMFNWTQWDDITFDPTITAYGSGAMGTHNYIQFPTSQANMRAKPWTDRLYSTLVIGMRIYRGNTSECLIGSFDGCGYFGVKSGGEIVYNTATNGDMNGGSWDSIATLPLTTWTYCEWKITFGNGSAGSVELFIDGQASGVHTSIDTIGSFQTATLTPSTFAMGHNVSGNVTQATWRFTDIYVGTEQLGPVEVWYQPCDQVGTSADFTPSAGANVDNVDEVGDPDGDTTYNESTTPGNKDSHGHDVTHVLGPAAIRTLAAVRANGDGHAKVRVGVNSAAVESYGGSFQIPDDYVCLQGPMQETDPATGSAWLKAAADAAETTIQHVA